jgi:hypothetical protein
LRPRWVIRRLSWLRKMGGKKCAGLATLGGFASLATRPR